MRSDGDFVAILGDFLPIFLPSFGEFLRVLVTFGEFLASFAECWRFLVDFGKFLAKF